MSLADNEAICTRRWWAWLSPPPGERKPHFLCRAGSAAASLSPGACRLEEGTVSGSSTVSGSVSAHNPRSSSSTGQSDLSGLCRPVGVYSSRRDRPRHARRRHNLQTFLETCELNRNTRQAMNGPRGVTVVVKAGDPRLRAAGRQDRCP